MGAQKLAIGFEGVSVGVCTYKFFKGWQEDIDLSFVALVCEG